MNKAGLRKFSSETAGISKKEGLSKMQWGHCNSIIWIGKLMFNLLWINLSKFVNLKCG